MRSVLLCSFLLFIIISAHAQNDSLSWSLIKLEHPGPEDFVYDGIYERLIIPSGRRDGEHPENSYGVFQTLDLTDHSVNTLNQDAELKEWISLGIKSVPIDTTFQFLTVATKPGGESGRIQGLSIDENAVRLVSKSIVTGDLPASINNIRWVEGKGLYITNLYKAKTITRGTLSNLKGEVYRANNLGEKAESVLEAHGPNGLGFLDSTLYLTGTREKFLMRINKDDRVEEMKTIPIIGGDNVTAQGNVLYTTGSPVLSEVMKHVGEKRETVGSLIYEMIKENGELRCRRIILVDPSIGMGMISVVYKHRGSFYCGQVLGANILCFKDEDTCLKRILVPKKNKYTRKIYARYKRLFRTEGVLIPEFVVLKSK